MNKKQKGRVFIWVQTNEIDEFVFTNGASGDNEDTREDLREIIQLWIHLYCPHFNFTQKIKK